MANVSGQEFSQLTISTSVKPILIIVTTSDIMPDMKKAMNNAKTTGA